MLAATYPLQVLLLSFSCVVNRHQADVIAYVVEENVMCDWAASSSFAAALHNEAGESGVCGGRPF